MLFPLTAPTENETSIRVTNHGFPIESMPPQASTRSSSKFHSLANKVMVFPVLTLTVSPAIRCVTGIRHPTLGRLVDESSGGEIGLIVSLYTDSQRLQFIKEL
jgi:hypothetical protein